ncbi:hypothetical protein [Paenibacillus sp. GP183]|uniref:hypothetical protein n=1 Tax=Paenibacillus sp. GP183 TaxID=1882751 RepID=UPI00089DA187|nr:hypothetical protein [Paenibacillus sp. GP183]SEB45724.1 hypothetical protein SAMN05443246_0455 [Paenibacillus sp. GP183]
MKKIFGVLVILIAIFSLSYKYIYNRVIEPFMIDAATETIESAASGLLNTQQTYKYRLVNTSDKSVKLLKIELQDYKGIKIDDVTIDGKAFSVQDVPTHRTYTSSNSWSTNNHGVNIEYHVEIKEPVIHNPKTFLITYSYWGFNHQQIVKNPIVSPSK